MFAALALDVLVLLAWVFIVITVDFDDEGDITEFILYSPLLIFALFEIPMTIYMWRLFSSKTPIIEIDSCGFHDRRITKNKIPWSDIKEIYRIHNRSRFSSHDKIKEIKIVLAELKLLRDYGKTNLGLSLFHSYDFKIPTYRLDDSRANIMEVMKSHKA